MTWDEWDGEGLGLPSDARVLYTASFSANTDALELALQRTGWVRNRHEAAELAHPENLHVGWFGYADDDVVPHACDQDGVSLVDPDLTVEVIMPMTYLHVLQ